MVPQIFNFSIDQIKTSRYWSPLLLKLANFRLASGLGLEFTSLKVSKGFSYGKSKSFRLKNLHSPERDLDFLVWN